MEKLVEREQLKSYYNGKKVFITGHTGFKGSWLTALLSLLGARIKGYALNPENENCLFNLLAPLNIIDSHIADIRDKEQLTKQILSFEPDFIFHLAAQPLVRKSYEIPSETFHINAVGTANLLEALKYLKKKCTVLIITTDKVYENKEKEILYNEEDILGGYDPYSASKACAEIIVNSFRNSFFNVNEECSYKKGIASLRAGNVIGGGDWSVDRIIPDLVKALKGNKIIDVRNPFAVRPWQHVLEPLIGYSLVGGLLNENINKFSTAYNFGPYPEDHLKVKELVEHAIQIWGGGEWINSSDISQPHEAKLLKLDISKAMRDLKWKPKLNAKCAIEWTIQWYKQPESMQADFTFEQINQYLNL